jgi:TPR repeat protein
MVGCESAAAAYLKGEGIPRDPIQAAASFETACSGGLATACSNLGLMHYSADGLPENKERGLDYLKKACDLGYANACRWLQETRR